MEEKIVTNTETELMEEEVNVYAGCGDPRYVCVSDCIVGPAVMISPLE